MRQFGFGFHLGEEQHFLDKLLARHEHAKTIDADADARCGRHAILQGAQKVLIDNHSLVVAFVGQFHLLFKTFLLIDGVVEFGVGIGQLLAVHHEFETLGEAGFRAVHLREWAHLHGIIGDEGGLDESAFTELTKDFVDELAFAKRGIDAF